MTALNAHFPLDRIAEVCRRYRIRRLWLFGSVLTDRFQPSSDIDVLIEDEPTNPIGLFALGGLQMDLSDLLGRSVHLTTLGAVPGTARDGLMASAQLAYAA